MNIKRIREIQDTLSELQEQLCPFHEAEYIDALEDVLDVLDDAEVVVIIENPQHADAVVNHDPDCAVY